MDNKLYEMAIIQNFKDLEIDTDKTYRKIDTGKCYVNICNLLRQIENNEVHYNELQEKAMHEIASDISKYGGINCINGLTYPPQHSYNYYATYKSQTWEEIMEDFHNFGKE